MDSKNNGNGLLQPGHQIRPKLSHSQVANLAKDFYALTDVSITDLNAYDDKNYHLKAKDNKNEDPWPHGCVMKVSNSLDSKNLQLIEAQNEMMIYLGNHGIICPQPVKNVHGKYYSLEKIYEEGGNGPYKEHVVRLLTYQPGKLLHEVPCTGTLFYRVGCYVASLDLKLQSFHHTAYDNHKTLWMLESVPALIDFIHAVKNPEQQKLAVCVIQKFQEEVLPLTDTLERGLLHGDFNEQNILVQSLPENDWYIYAVLDFGDCHVSCYIFELAVTICYMMLQSKLLDPLEAGGHVIAGYSSQKVVPQIEFQLLKTCVSARLCQSLVLGAYSYQQDPGNQYILTTAATGWSLLEMLWHTSEDELYQRWKTIMSSYSLKNH